MVAPCLLIFLGITV